MKNRILIISQILVAAVLIQSASSCKKNNSPTQKQTVKLDSSVYMDQTALKYVYINDRISYGNRYFLFYPQDSQLIGKISYVYNGDKIIEKTRVFFPTNTIFWKSFFTYTSEGRLNSITILNRNTTNGNLYTKIKLNILYDQDRIVASEYFEWGPRLYKSPIIPWLQLSVTKR